jgi:hypothetical protein
VLLADRLGREPLVDDFKRNTARKLEGVRCPDHRQSPRLKFHGATLREVTVQMSGCCAKLIEMANRAITNRG